MIAGTAPAHSKYTPALISNQRGGTGLAAVDPKVNAAQTNMVTNLANRTGKGTLRLPVPPA